jgi:hypothetical protein
MIKHKLKINDKKRIEEIYPYVDADLNKILPSILKLLSPDRSIQI